ncbi:hypothetical protein B0H12DRAFT_1164133 [Mycena haematopus]|nr:hypothetical protein B0H12DRAFT_1164133 [Mycena haematopus]
MPTKMRRVVLGSISAALASRVHLAATTKIGRLPTRHGARRTGLLIRSRVTPLKRLGLPAEATRRCGVCGHSAQIIAIPYFPAAWA